MVEIFLTAPLLQPTRSMSMSPDLRTVATAPDNPRQAGVPAVVAGRYTVLRLLGRGNVAWVYEAHDDQLGRTVALKLLVHEDAARRLSMRLPELLERFEQEAELLRSLQIPGVVRVYDWGRTDAFHWMAMELLDGESLRDLLLRQGPLPVARATRLARQVAAAMEGWHRAGYIHRDVKPANIMSVVPTRRMSTPLDVPPDSGLIGLHTPNPAAPAVPGEERAVVVDFGIATRYPNPSGRRLTFSGRVVGSPEYMSPEQSRGIEVDPRSDIYSLGILLYELVCGAPPFKGANPAEVMRRQVADFPQEMRLANPSLRAFDGLEDFENLVLCCLDKNPDARFGSATAVVGALDSFGRRWFP